jgi:hypothetical protein
MIQFIILNRIGLIADSTDIAYSLILILFRAIYILCFSKHTFTQSTGDVQPMEVSNRKCSIQ